MKYRLLSRRLTLKINRILRRSVTHVISSFDKSGCVDDLVHLAPRASRSCLVGDVVWVEKPLICCKHDYKKMDVNLAVQSLRLQEGLGDAGQYLQYLLRYGEAPEDVQSRVLRLSGSCHDLFWGQNIMGGCAAFASQIAAVLEEDNREHCPQVLQPIVGMSETTVLKVLSVWRVHGVEVPSGVAIYEQMSQIPNACLDATVIFIMEGDVCMLKATRPMMAGTQLTINRLHPCQRLMSTRCRCSWLMRNRMERCTCVACAEPSDVLRMLPCPSCQHVLGKHEGIDSDQHSEVLSSDGFDEDDWEQSVLLSSKDSLRPQSTSIQQVAPICAEDAGHLRGYVIPRAPTHLLEAHKPWVCMTCQGSFSRVKMQRYIRQRADLSGCLPVYQEEDIEDLVASISPTSSSMPYLEALHAHCHAVLGPRHWTTNMVLLYMMNKTVLELPSRTEFACCGDYSSLHTQVMSLCDHLGAYDLWLRSSLFEGALRELCLMVVKVAGAVLLLLRQPECPAALHVTAMQLMPLLGNLAWDVNHDPSLASQAVEVHHVARLMEMYVSPEDSKMNPRGDAMHLCSSPFRGGLPELPGRTISMMSHSQQGCCMATMALRLRCLSFKDQGSQGRAKMQGYGHQQEDLSGRLPVYQEEDIEDLVASTSPTSSSMPYLEALHSHCRAVLGPRHWTTNMVLLYMMDKTVLELPSRAEFACCGDYSSLHTKVMSLCDHLWAYDLWLRSSLFDGALRELCPLVVKVAGAILDVMHHPNWPLAILVEASEQLLPLVRALAWDVDHDPSLASQAMEVHHLARLMEMYVSTKEDDGWDDDAMHVCSRPLKLLWENVPQRLKRTTKRKSRRQQGSWLGDLALGLKSLRLKRPGRRKGISSGLTARLLSDLSIPPSWVPITPPCQSEDNNSEDIICWGAE